MSLQCLAALAAHQAPFMALHALVYVVLRTQVPPLRRRHFLLQAEIAPKSRHFLLQAETAPK